VNNQEKVTFDEKALSEFVAQTLKGKYGQVERTSLKYVRVKEVSLPVHQAREEDFFFSVDGVR